MRTLLPLLSCFAVLLGEASAVTLTMSGAVGGAVAGGNFEVATVGTAAATNNYPSGESPGNLLDGSAATRYMNFAKLNTGIIVGSSSGFPLQSLTFTTANDAADRDPLTFSVYGSAVALTGAGPFSLASLTAITLNASTGLEVDPGRLSVGSLRTFANSTAYASYVVVFPTVRNTAANAMHLAEITFASSVPEPGAALLTGFTLAGLGLIRRRR